MALDLGLKQDIAFYDALYVQVALELQLPFLIPSPADCGGIRTGI